MAKNNHLFTVYHSLDGKGAFDEPQTRSGPNDDPNDIQGKYWLEKTEYPKYVHAKGHESVIVANADEEKEVIKAFADKDAAAAKAEAIHSKNHSELTKTEMLEKAKKLGIKVDGRASEKKLAYLIEEAESAEVKVA